MYSQTTDGSSPVVVLTRRGRLRIHRGPYQRYDNRRGFNIYPRVVVKFAQTSKVADAMTIGVPDDTG
jgi:acyl-CoA synthetase (AMP-forming)/AMP-acid ligase II